jgi:hypothetical protein
MKRLRYTSSDPGFGLSSSREHHPRTYPGVSWPILAASFSAGATILVVVLFLLTLGNF